MQNVPRIEVHTKNDFLHLLQQHTPMIITNFQSTWYMNNSPTNSANQQQQDTQEEKNIASSSSSSLNEQINPFSQTNLLQKFGNSMIRVSVSETGRFDGPEDGQLWGLTNSNSGNGDVLVRPPQTSMLFGDFLTLLNRQDQNHTNSGKDNSNGVKETFYLEYLALHQYLGKVSILGRYKYFELYGR